MINLIELQKKNYIFSINWNKIEQFRFETAIEPWSWGSLIAISYGYYATSCQCHQQDFARKSFRVIHYMLIYAKGLCWFFYCLQCTSYRAMQWCIVTMVGFLCSLMQNLYCWTLHRVVMHCNLYLIHMFWVFILGYILWIFWLLLPPRFWFFEKFV